MIYLGSCPDTKEIFGAIEMGAGFVDDGKVVSEEDFVDIFSVGFVVKIVFDDYCFDFVNYGWGVF